MSLKNEIRKAVMFITTEGGDDGGTGDNGSADGGDDSGAGTGSDELSTLFSPEEVEAKRTALADAKAEDERRSALTDEQRAAEDAERVAQEALNGVPEKYELKIPEGYKVDEELMAEVTEYAKANKLTAAAAQQISELGVKLLQKQEQAKQAEFAQIKETWLNTAQKDKEIGEDVLAGKDGKAARAFNTIATQEMKDMVDAYGIGNHPEMLRMFYRLSSLMGEDGLAMPSSGAGLTGGKSAGETVGSIFNHPSRKVA